MLTNIHYTLKVVEIVFYKMYAVHAVKVCRTHFHYSSIQIMSHKNITFRKSEYVVLRNLENVFSDKQYTVVQGLYKKVFGPVTYLENVFSDKQYTVVQGLYKKVFGPVTNLENVSSDKQYTVVQGLYKKVFGPVTNL